MDVRRFFLGQYAAKRLETLLSSLAFQYVFWTLTTALLGIIAFLLLSQQISTIELSLLNLKMRLKSELTEVGTTPSRDIVILGIDGNTDQYIRLHPTSGLGMVIPRERMARVVDYLTRQGVKAILFDLEFKDKKPGDAALAAAIQRNGHVYAAARMDYDLENYTEEKSELSERLLLSEGLMIPVLREQADFKVRFLPFWKMLPFDAGVGPYFHPLSDVEPLLNNTIGQLNQKWTGGLDAQRKSRYMRLNEQETTHFNSVEERAYSRLCLERNYEAAYANNPDFLHELGLKRLPMKLNQPISSSMNRQISQCYTFPIVLPIIKALSGIGISSIDYDDDAYIRSVPAFYQGHQGHFYTYLGLLPALALGQNQSIAYQPGILSLNNRRIPLWEGDKILINWRNPKWLVQQILTESRINLARHPQLKAKVSRINAERKNALLGGGHIYRQISLIDILRLSEGETLKLDEASRLSQLPYYPETGPFSFKNKIVVIGNTVTDIHRTPMSNTMFGPEVVASVLDMMMNDHSFIYKPPFWAQATLVSLLALSIILVIITFDHFAVGFSVALMLIVIYWLINLIVFVRLGLLLDVLIPSATLGFSLAAASLYRYSVHDREKHHLTHVFSKYVSPQIMHEIIKNPEKAMDHLKGEKKVLTVLFSDLKGFTQQFENADPELMVQQLNEYFDVMTDILLKYGGTYDKYMGDSIMAFFGAPTDVSDHAAMACLAALEMENALKTLNEQWILDGRKILSHGIGISSGEMFVGNFGSKNIKNFTVMGSNVNLGSRLEAYTRLVEWPVILSAKTWEMAHHRIEAEDLGRIQIKGFTEKVQIYGLKQTIAPES